MNNQEIYNQYHALCTKNNADQEKIELTWQELVQHYTESTRQYHNLVHIENMLADLKHIEHLVKDVESVKWSVIFHDLIYDATRDDNEERSALSALKYLNNLKVPFMKILKIQGMILATKLHENEEGETDHDLNYFLDLDLAILGSDEKKYDLYAEQIRKEYQHVPANDYKKGRAGVLESFLKTETIFKTDYFKSRLEDQARKNLKRELVSLQ